jgi:hypothetical protein
MLTDAFVARHQDFLRRHGHPSGPRGMAEYRRFMRAGAKRGSPGAYDAALPRSASRSTDYLPRPAMIAGDRSLPGFQMLPVRTWQGSHDLYLGGAGRGMARDQNGEARSELTAWAREHMSPDDAAKLEELVAAILEDEQAQRERHEQPRLVEHLRKKHDLTDGEIERVKDLILGRDQSGRAPPFAWSDTPWRMKNGSALAMDPPVSEKQARAMHAAAEGRSTLGIPREVGKHFVGEDDWTGSAERPIGRKAPPTAAETPEDDEVTARIKGFLGLFSHLLTPADIEQAGQHALEQTRAARRRQPAASSGSADERRVAGDSARRRNSDREVRSFKERFPGAPAPFAAVPSAKVFVR